MGFPPRFTARSAVGDFAPPIPNPRPFLRGLWRLTMWQHSIDQGFAIRHALVAMLVISGNRFWPEPSHPPAHWVRCDRAAPQPPLARFTGWHIALVPLYLTRFSGCTSASCSQKVLSRLRQGWHRPTVCAWTRGQAVIPTAASMTITPTPSQGCAE